MFQVKMYNPFDAVNKSTPGLKPFPKAKPKPKPRSKLAA